MKAKKPVGLTTLLLFCITLMAGSYSPLFSQSEESENQISKLLKEADEHYQNGEFSRAIQAYEAIISRLNEKKELAQTRQRLNP